ncbi:MAG: AraC family transcriptional regulator [Clostridia bacterium]|nr:AraC family transcriptional regulator [Clostridia bacterium]
MYEISSPTIIVIPPNVYHKTEGGTFTRYNIIVSPNGLNPYQQKTLNDLKLLVIKLNEGENRETLRIFEAIINIDDTKNAKYIKETLFSYLIYSLSKITCKIDKKFTNRNKQMPSDIIKIISYMYGNYRENITLDKISKEFFISKSTLNYEFKNSTGFTPIEYLIRIRLLKAK